MEAILRAGSASQLRAARTVIRVHVCIHHVGDSHVLAGGERDVGINVVCARIDHGALTERSAAEEI
jgi:hypothetical protein